MKNLSRRTFLDLGKRIIAFFPLANIIACTEDPGSKINPENSLKKLIFVIGPWTLEDRLMAEDFANRFLQANQIVSQYLPESADIIQRLAARFSNDDLAVKEINLDKLPAGEGELLMILGKQLYNFVEVRFYISKVPAWGQCLGDSMWHTKAPD